MAQYIVFGVDNLKLWIGEAGSRDDARGLAWESVRKERKLSPRAADSVIGDVCLSPGQTAMVSLKEISAPSEKDGYVRDLDQEVVSGLVEGFTRDGWGSVPPILVTPDGRVVAGGHRYAAARKAGLTAALVTVVTDGEAGVLRVRENLVRSDLSLPDLARGLAALTTQERDGLIKTSGRSAAWQSKVRAVVMAYSAGRIDEDALAEGLEACYERAKAAKSERDARGRKKKESTPSSPSPSPSPSPRPVPAPAPAPAPASDSSADSVPPPPGKAPVWALYESESLGAFVDALRACGVSESFLEEWGLI